MDSRELDYDLPQELIAQHPAERRDDSRLLVYSRATGEVRHRIFHELPSELPPGTLSVVNDTRVLLARLLGHKASGGRVELLLVERLAAQRWLAMAKSSKPLRPGAEVRFDRLRTQQWVRARLAIGRAVGYSTPSTLGTRMMPATAKFDPPALRPIRKSVHAASLTRANWQAAPRRSSCICGRSISGVSLAAS